MDESEQRNDDKVARIWTLVEEGRRNNKRTEQFHGEVALALSSGVLSDTGVAGKYIFIDFI